MTVREKTADPMMGCDARAAGFVLRDCGVLEHYPDRGGSAVGELAASEWAEDLDVSFSRWISSNSPINPSTNVRVSGVRFAIDILRNFPAFRFHALSIGRQIDSSGPSITNSSLTREPLLDSGLGLGGLGCGHARGYTLIELLVSIVIVGFLVGILMPAVQAVREAARKTDCSNRIRQIGLALLNFESVRGHLPSGLARSGPNPYMTWMVPILPFIDRGPDFDQALADYALFPFPFSNHELFDNPVDLYSCPSDPRSGVAQQTHGNRLVATTNYLGVNGTNYTTKDGVFYRDSTVRLTEVVDGLSNTMLIGERPPSTDFWYGWWYAGSGQAGTGSVDCVLGVREIKHRVSVHLNDCPFGPYEFGPGSREQCDALHFWSYHPGGAHFVLCDGSNKFLAFDKNEILPSLATRNGSEVVQ